MKILIGKNTGLLAIWQNPMVEGEQSLLPGIKFAERFADYGITGLSVSLYGTEGLPDSPNQCPLEMFLPAVE